MRILQEIYIELRMFIKPIDGYYYTKFLYIKPDSKLGFWKYEVLDEYGNIIFQN